MALTLQMESGNGDAGANCYTNVAEADLYHEAHLYADAWFAMTISQKEQGLVWATRVLDEQAEWHGWKVSVAQPLRWPRGGVNARDTIGDWRNLYGYYLPSNVIPVWLKAATAELARYLKIGDRTAPFDNEGFKDIKIGPLELVTNVPDRPSVLPDSVIAIIEPYAQVHQRNSVTTARLLRV